MSTQSVLQKLSAEISQHASTMSDQLSRNNSQLALEDISQWKDASFRSSRIALIQSCREMLEVAVGPVDRIKDEIPMV